MKYIQLNNTDLNVSRICLGTAGFGDKLDHEKSFKVLDTFVQAGGNFIDTANVYCKWLEGHGNCSEQIIGRWLKARGARGKVIVATKGAHYSFENPGRSRVNREDIRADLDESLRTLGTEVIDFYWLHRDDPEKPVEEIVDILEEMQKEGRIRYFGFSNYRTDRLKALEQCLKERKKSGVTAVSNQWSLAGINPGGNTNPDPTLVEFSRRNTGGTVRQVRLPFRFHPRQWDFSQNFRKWEFHIRMKRWMHPGCRRKSHRLQIFQKA